MKASDRPIAYVAMRSLRATQNENTRRTIERWMVQRGNRVAVRLAGGEPMQSGGAIIMVGPVPMAIMSIDAPLATEVFVDDLGQRNAWPEWQAVAAEHRAHLIVAPLISEPDRFAARHLATCTAETASAIATLDDALGVYWVPAQLFSARESFAEFLPTRRRTQAELMIRLRWFGSERPDGRGMGACTKGLALFAGRELLHPSTDERASVVQSRVLDLCNYLIDHGPALTDGDTVGREAGEGIRVVRARSSTGEEVFRLDIGATPTLLAG